MRVFRRRLLGMISAKSLLIIFPVAKGRVRRSEEKLLEGHRRKVMEGRRCLHLTTVRVDASTGGLCAVERLQVVPCGAGRILGHDGVKVHGNHVITML